MSLSTTAQSYELGGASTVGKTSTRRSQSTNYRKIAIILSVVAFVLLIISVVFITLYVLKVMSQKGDEQVTAKPSTGEVIHPIISGPSFNLKIFSMKRIENVILVK